MPPPGSDMQQTSHRVRSCTSPAQLSTYRHPLGAVCLAAGGHGTRPRKFASLMWDVCRTSSHFSAISRAPHHTGGACQEQPGVPSWCVIRLGRNRRQTAVLSQPSHAATRHFRRYFGTLQLNLSHPSLRSRPEALVVCVAHLPSQWWRGRGGVSGDNSTSMISPLSFATGRCAAVALGAIDRDQSHDSVHVVSTKCNHRLSSRAGNLPGSAWVSQACYRPRRRGAATERESGPAAHSPPQDIPPLAGQPIDAIRVADPGYRRPLYSYQQLT